MSALRTRNDIELFQSWCNGDKAAGNALFDRYFESVYLFFCNKIRDGVEDLTQDTFLALIQGRERFRGEASFRTYLFRTARNLLCKAYRKQGRQCHISDCSVTSVLDLGLPPRSLTVLRHEYFLLLTGLQQLPLDYQIALELYYWEGMSGPELAEALDITVPAARSRLRRGIEQLRQHMSALAKKHKSDDAEVEPDIEGWTRAIRDMLIDPL